MKIIAYSVRDEEIEIFNSISFNLGFEIKLVPQHLTEDNINLAEGFDAVIFTGSGTVNRKVLEMMKKFNIKFASTKSAGTDNIDLKYPNIIVTPHIGFFTDEAVKNQIETSLNNVSEFLKTNKCQNEIILNKKIKNKGVQR